MVPPENSAAQREENCPAPHFQSPGAAGPLSIVAPKELEMRFWAQVTLGEECISCPGELGYSLSFLSTPWTGIPVSLAMAGSGPGLLSLLTLGSFGLLPICMSVETCGFNGPS